MSFYIQNLEYWLVSAVSPALLQKPFSGIKSGLCGNIRVKVTSTPYTNSSKPLQPFLRNWLANIKTQRDNFLVNTRLLIVYE